MLCQACAEKANKGRSLPSKRLARFTGSPMQPYFIFLLLPMFPASTSLQPAFQWGLELDG